MTANEIGKADLDVAWEVLKDEEKHILERRFALNGGKAETLQHIGDDLGFSRERVRQLQNLALGKLRRAIELHGQLSDARIGAILAQQRFDRQEPVLRPKQKPKPRPKRKPKRVQVIPMHTDSERLDWLEETMRRFDLRINVPMLGGFALSHQRLRPVYAKNLRDLISLAIAKKND